MIDILRERWGAHPLVHEQPYVGPGRQLLVEAQDEAGVAPEYQLVAIVGGQLLLLPPAESFVEKVEWSSDVPVRWRPHADPNSPVRIDPEVRFGKPAVRGISTEVVWEHIEADESFGKVADQFDLTLDEPGGRTPTRPPPRPSGVRTASVRFYFDADILGLGKLIASVRPDVTYPGDPGTVLHKRRRPACPITSPHTDDAVWIPIVARSGWVRSPGTVTSRTTGPSAAVRDHRLVMVALSAPEARTTWDQLEVVLCQWRAIEVLADSQGLLLYLATRTSLRAVPL